MNVQRVDSFEAETAGSSRERTGGKGSGFSEFMDSALGAGSENRAAARESGESRVDNTSHGRDLRSGSAEPRKPVRADKKEENEELPAEESGVESEPVPAEAAFEEKVAKSEHKDARGKDEELVVIPEAPAYELAAPLAVPVVDGLSIGETGEAIDSVEITVAEVDSGAASDDAVFESSAVGRVAEGDAEVAQATSGRSVISDPAARDGFLAALEGAQSKQDEVVSAVEGEQAPAAELNRSAEAAPRTLQNTALGARVAPLVDEGRRGELETAVLRSSGIRQEGARSQSDLGSDDFSRERRGETPQPALIPVERTSGDAAAPVSAAAVDGASAGVVETPLRTEEATAQPRLDSLPTSTPTRAPELPPTLQTGRALPTPAPDAIAIQADWLATRGGGTARLVLNPPELGEISIRVTVRQQSVEIVMIARTALAHSMAEDQADRLSQAFAHRDLRLDQFEVRRGDPADSSGTGQFGSSDAGAREHERAQDERGVPGGAGGREGRRSVAMDSDGIVPSPRAVSSAMETRVDLRI